MVNGLRRNGVDVIECHEKLWQGIEDRIAAASGRWLSPVFVARVVRAYACLIWSYLRTPKHDVVVVGYPGQFDVFVVRLLSRLRRTPLVWDIFMSTYLIAQERGLEQTSPRTVAFLRDTERAACRLPDRLILDTEDYVAWFHRVHGVDESRFRLVPTGADDTSHYPTPASESVHGPWRILYYGTFIPNHGVEWIVEAARLLARRRQFPVRADRRGARARSGAGARDRLRVDERHVHSLAGEGSAPGPHRGRGHLSRRVRRHAPVAHDRPEQDLRGDGRCPAGLDG